MADSDWGPVIQHGRAVVPVSMNTEIRYGWDGTTQLERGTYIGFVNNPDPRPWRYVRWYQIRQYKELNKLRELIEEPAKTPLPA